MKKILVLVILTSMVLGITAFQCSSTEMTSAKLYVQQKKYDKAEEMLNKELEKNPKNDEAYYFLGYLKGEKGDIEAMNKAYDKSLEISKKFEKNITDSRKYHWGRGFNAGVAFFNRASKVNSPDSAKMFYDKSVKAFNEAIACQPDSVATYKNLAFAYMNAGQMGEAIPAWKKIIELEKSPDAYASIGEIYMQEAYDNANNKDVAQKYFEQAIEILTEGRNAFPKDNIILRDLANAYVGAEKTDVAIEAFKAGVEQEPENKFYRYNYGSLLLKIKNYDEASKQLQKAVDIDPQYLNALYNLGVSYVYWGADLREKAEEEESKSIEYQEKFKLALSAMEKYIELKPDAAEVWELLGKIYANLGMTEKSEKAFKEADKNK